jgi:hypothetical protein
MKSDFPKAFLRESDLACVTERLLDTVAMLFPIRQSAEEVSPPVMEHCFQNQPVRNSAPGDSRLQNERELIHEREPVA